jgi:hypothetical protein
VEHIFLNRLLTDSHALVGATLDALNLCLHIFSDTAFLVLWFLLINTFAVLATLLRPT